MSLEALHEKRKTKLYQTVAVFGEEQGGSNNLLAACFDLGWDLLSCGFSFLLLQVGKLGKAHRLRFKFRRVQADMAILRRIHDNRDIIEPKDQLEYVRFPYPPQSTPLS